MAEPVDHVISKVNHWPLNKRREYLILALKCEKTRHRREKLSQALCTITTDIIKQEIRHERS